MTTKLFANYSLRIGLAGSLKLGTIKYFVGFLSANSTDIIINYLISIAMTDISYIA